VAGMLASVLRVELIEMSMNWLSKESTHSDEWGRSRLSMAAFIMTGGLSLLWAGAALALNSTTLLIGAMIIVLGSTFGVLIQRFRSTASAIVIWGGLAEIGLFIASESIDASVNPAALTTVLGITLPLLMSNISKERLVVGIFTGSATLGWIFSTVTDGALFADYQVPAEMSKLVVGPALSATVFVVLGAIAAFLMYVDQSKTRALRAALAKVEKDSAEKGAFLSALSHEMITPLNGIVGYSELLEPENATEFGSRITKLSQGMILMLQKGLQFGSLKGTFYTFGSEAVGCRKLIDEVIAGLPAFIDSPADHLSIHDPRNVHTLINRAALKIAISEILENALLYRQPGSKVDVYVSAKHSGGVRIAITNKGQRPTTAEFQTALKPYARLDRANGPVPGLGIGLTRAVDAITESGGEIILLPSPPDSVSIGIELPILWANSNSERLGLAS